MLQQGEKDGKSAASFEGLARSLRGRTAAVTRSVDAEMKRAAREAAAAAAAGRGAGGARGGAPRPRRAGAPAGHAGAVGIRGHRAPRMTQRLLRAGLPAHAFAAAA